MEISLIAAMDIHRGIGNDNKLPWNIPEDMKRFTELTKGKVVIMGHNTYKSIGRALPNRTNIVISKKIRKLGTSMLVASDPVNAIILASKHISQNQPEVMVIGGAMLYETFLPLANRMYLTKIHENYECDTYFPYFIKDEWEIKNSTRFDNDSGISLDFINYERV